MQRKQDGLVPIGEALSGLDGPVKAICEASPQAVHHFTQADQVNQLVGASEADPDLGGSGGLDPASLDTRDPSGTAASARGIKLQGFILRGGEDETENIHRILPKGDLDRRRRHPADDSW